MANFPEFHVAASQNVSSRATARVVPAPVLRAGTPLDAPVFRALCRRYALEGHKWDSQVGDLTALAPYPLVLRADAWRTIAAQAEQLAAEATAAAWETLQRPELLRHLGLPAPLRRVLSANSPLTPAAGHVMRFDFHPTTEGWRISEVNSDVPGGFGEASHFTAMMAAHFTALRPAGDPASAWADALAATASTGSGDVVALLSAPGYMEDHQVVSFLAAQLRARGLRAHLATPRQIRWENGTAHLDTAWHRGRVAAVVRFFQAEWLPQLRGTDWRCFFRGGRTPVAAPPHAVVSESKRFPLIWDALSTRLPAWRELLPETRSPLDIPAESGDAWLFKTAFCNTGDAVCMRELMPQRRWWRTRLSSLLSPRRWLAQRRFVSVPVETPHGPRHACIGVYTVNGRAAGAYARLSPGPVIDFAAMDAALLVENDE